MAKHHPQNERIKRQYFTYLKEAQRYSEASVDGVAKALARFESYTGYKDFKSFHRQQAVGFKKKLVEQPSLHVKGEKLSASTLYSTLQALKRFFLWLARQAEIIRQLGKAKEKTPQMEELMVKLLTEMTKGQVVPTQYQENSYARTEFKSDERGLNPCQTGGK